MGGDFFHILFFFLLVLGTGHCELGAEKWALSAER
jgi:hypothetical protein